MGTPDSGLRLGDGNMRTSSIAVQFGLCKISQSHSSERLCSVAGNRKNELLMWSRPEL